MAPRVPASDFLPNLGVYRPHSLPHMLAVGSAHDRYTMDSEAMSFGNRYSANIQPENIYVNFEASMNMPMESCQPNRKLHRWCETILLFYASMGLGRCSTRHWSSVQRNAALRLSIPGTRMQWVQGIYLQSRILPCTGIARENLLLFIICIYIYILC